MANPGLLGRKPQPQRGYHLRRFVPERVRVRLSSRHHDHEVLRVADDAIGGTATFAVRLAPIRSGVSITFRTEMLIQYRERDIGQQRRNESGSGDALPRPRYLRTVRARRPRIR